MLDHTTDAPLDLTGRPAAAPKPRLGRRISWAELHKLRPDLRPANDDQPEREAA